MSEALFYYRISEDRTGERLGVERQEPESVELCDRLGFTRGRAYVDNDKSATKIGVVRDEFEQLLRDLHANPRPVIVWHTDRLIRTSKDLERVIDTGVNVHAVHAGHFDLSTPAGRAVAKTLTAWAQYEGEQKALRQRTANLQRAQKGKSWWPRRPFGLEMDGTLRQDEAAALAECYDMLLAGASIPTLARWLNDQGMMTNLDNPWTASSLRPILLNARNAGIRVYDGAEIGKAAWSAIVPEETYRQAVRLLSDPARQHGGGGARVYLMSGIAQCGKCGAGVRVTHRGGKDGGYATYACRGQHCMSHRVEWVDETVLEMILLALESPSLASVWAASGDEASEIRADIVKQREKMLEYEEDRDNDLMSRESFIRMMGKARERLTMLELALDQALGTSPVAALAQAKDPRAEWKGMGLHMQRAVVQSVFRHFKLLPRGRGVRHAGPEHIDYEWNHRSAHLRAV